MSEHFRFEFPLKTGILSPEEVLARTKKALLLAGWTPSEGWDVVLDRNEICGPGTRENPGRNGETVLAAVSGPDGGWHAARALSLLLAIIMDDDKLAPSLSGEDQSSLVVTLEKSRKGSRRDAWVYCYTAGKDDWLRVRLVPNGKGYVHEQTLYKNAREYIAFLRKGTAAVDLYLQTRPSGMRMPEVNI